MKVINTTFPNLKDIAKANLRQRMGEGGIGLLFQYSGCRSRRISVRSRQPGLQSESWTGKTTEKDTFSKKERGAEQKQKN